MPAAMRRDKQALTYRQRIAVSFAGGFQRNKSTDVRPLFRNPNSSPSSILTKAFGFRLGWLITTDYRFSMTYELANTAMPDKIFGSVNSNLQSLSAFLQVFYPIVPNRGINGYVGGGLGYHHSSLSGKNIEGENSDNLALRLAAGAEHHVDTNWWLLTEIGYEQVVVRQMQINPSNFRILFGFGYKWTNY